jgi:1-acyl-sn-glycerol-3-phosphate acyltransferase
MDSSRKSPPPKPVSKIWRPELVQLPKLTLARHMFRKVVVGLLKLLAWLCLYVSVEGLEYLPRHGPAIVAINHLGEADAAVLMPHFPFMPEVLGKIELYDFPILGKLMDWYGMIWLHRGQPDKRALRAALKGLAEGRIILIAPEGRESLAGGLEQGQGGAAFLAGRAQVEIIPVALIGTDNAHVYGEMRRFRRARVGMRVGKPLKLLGQADRHAAIRDGTRQIMESLADLLPVEYRGAYAR